MFMEGNDAFSQNPPLILSILHLPKIEISHSLISLLNPIKMVCLGSNCLSLNHPPLLLSLL